MTYTRKRGCADSGRSDRSAGAKYLLPRAEQWGQNDGINSLLVSCNLKNIAVQAESLTASTSSCSNQSGSSGSSGSPAKFDPSSTICLAAICWFNTKETNCLVAAQPLVIPLCLKYSPRTNSGLIKNRRSTLHSSCMISIIAWQRSTAYFQTYTIDIPAEWRIVGTGLGPRELSRLVQSSQRCRRCPSLQIDNSYESRH